MKVFGIIMGILLVIGGFTCAFTPVATFISLGSLVGFAMLIEGVGSIISWSARKQAGLADGWTLAGSIATVILGLFVLASGLMQLSIDLFLAYLAALWLVIEGIARIAGSFKLRNARHRGAVIGANWGWVLAAGVLTLIGGIICLFHPIFAMAGVGIMIGLGIVSSGMGLIVVSLCV